MLINSFVIIILTLAILIISCVLALIGRCWQPISNFFHVRYSFFEITFVFIYFTEQFTFLVLSYFFKEYHLLFSGVFALVVISTVFLQGIMMECKNRKLREFNQEFPIKIKELKNKHETQFFTLQEKIQKLQEEKKDLIDYLQKKPRKLK